jgi:hypothetical protein
MLWEMKIQGSFAFIIAEVDSFDADLAEWG